jgi:preprotein translocase subunit YajC
MSEEYLWNRRGEPDEETVRLEKLLSAFQYRETRRRAPATRLWWLAAAAVLLAGVVAVPAFRMGRETNWQFANGNRLRAGQIVETGSGLHTTIQSASTGEVKIDPDSRLRLVQATNREQRFDLQHGTIHAFIWAPPGRFVVDTPSAKTVDLGCRYTLQTSKDGSGLLSVEMGWVAFQFHELESFIPAGAACATRPGHGPDTPYFMDAPDALKTALARFDALQDPAALETVMASARERDALTLWHLLLRTRGSRRAEVFDRFATLVKLPPEVSKEAILRSDARAIDGAWNALDLGETGWWRQWKRTW